MRKLVESQQAASTIRRNHRDGICRERVQYAHGASLQHPSVVKFSVTLSIV